MIGKIVSIGALLAAFAVFPSPGAAQSQNGSANGNSMSKDSTSTVQGCVAAGKKSGTFVLNGDDGITYFLMTKTQDFSQHVGHEVSVTGHIREGDVKNVPADNPDSTVTPAKTGTTNTEIGGSNVGSSSGKTVNSSNAGMKHHLIANSVSMVSDSCTAK